MKNGQIIVKNKKCSLSNILKEFPNAEIFDVTSKVGAINEYNFGLHTPDVKSLFNTFNFTFNKLGKLATRKGAFSMKNGGLINTIINYGRKNNKRTRSI